MTDYKYQLAAGLTGKSHKHQVILAIGDSVSNLLYYDRKEDESLPRGAIEALIASGEITVDEMIAAFAAELEHLR